MASSAVKTLEQALKRSSLDGAYYICGEDEFQKEDAMKRLIAAALDPTVRDFNLDVLRAQDTDPKSFDGIVSSMPMMAERRVVVVRDVSTLRKEARKAIERFLNKPSPSVLLLLVESTGGKTEQDLTRITTALEFEPFSADEVPRWIMRRAITEFKAQISPRAAELLQSAAGNDLHHLAMELEKLVSFANGRAITEETVSAVVGIRHGETMTDLLDAIGKRDVTASLGLLDHVMSQPKTTAVQIVMLLAAQTIALAWGRAKLDEGLPPGRLQSEYFGLLRDSGSAYTGRPWGTAAGAWASTTSAWDHESLERAFDALLTADVALKETRVSSEEQVLTTLILAMCTGDEHKIAA